MTTTAGLVPVTVQGSFDYPDVVLVVGNQQIGPSTAPNNSYWWVILDLTSLQVQVNTVSTSNSQVPAEVQPYLGKPNALLLVTSVAIRSDHLPQGAMASALQAAGAGPQLARAEQIFEALNTGTIGYMSYILAATTDTSDGGGFEEFSYTTYPVMTFQLMPVQIDGQTVYTPIQSGA